MTTLAFKMLVSTLSQEVEYDLEERVHIGCVSPYLLMVGAPSGTFTIQMSGSNGTVLSKSFTSSDIKTSLSTSNNNAHVFYPVINNNPCQIERGAYTITLSSSGYTPSNSSYMGWIQQFEDVQNVLSYTPNGFGERPLAVRIKDYKEGIL